MAFTDWIVLAVVQAFAEVLLIGAAAQISVINAWTTLVAGTGFGVASPALALGIRLGLALGAASYFWQDLAEMIQGLARLAKGKRDPGARLAFLVVVAAVPSIGLAFAAEEFGAGEWRTAMVTAWCAAGVGLLLLLFDSTCMTVKRVEHAGLGDALLLGLAQALALVPGVGRIAAATAMARMLGYERQEAARFAFLISIPVLLAGVAWHVPKVVAAEQPFPTNAVLVGFALAYFTSVVLIAVLMGWLRRRTFAPFAIYRLLIAANLIVIAYGWL